MNAAACLSGFIRPLCAKRWSAGTVLLFAVISIGCTDLDIIAPSARLSCASAADCPDTFVCRDSIGECVAEDLLNVPPLAFVFAPTLSETIVSARPGFSAVQFTATLSEKAERVLEVNVNGTDLDCGDGLELVCDFDVAELELDEGLYAVTVFAMDAAGNELRGAVEFFVDTTGPTLVGAPALRLTAATGNPVTQPTALGRDLALATVDIVVTEPLQEAPVVTLMPPEGGGVALPLTLVSDEDPLNQIAFTYALALDDGPVDEGVRRIDVVATDLVGNVASIETDTTITVDVTAPSPPDTTSVAPVVFKRAPWGSQATNFAPRFSLEGPAGSVEENALVVARITEDPTSLVVGQGPADQTGALDLLLLPIDIPRVSLVAVDGAGNASTPATTHSVEWTASLGSKVVGSKLENPHEFSTSPTFDGKTLNGLLDAEAPLTPWLVSETAGPITTEARQVFQPFVKGQTNFEPLAGLGMAFHQSRGTVFAFGGNDNAFGVRNTTYELIGDVWTTIETTTTPPAGRAQMVFDSARNRLVCRPVDGTTWVFENLQWRELSIAAQPSIANGRLAYDPAHGVTVLTNGLQTAIFDGEQWETLEFGLSDVTPPERDFAALGFNPQAGALMLYGGAIASVGTLFGDRWHLRFASDAGWFWEQTTDASPRTGHALVFDSNRNRLLSVGGGCGDPVECPDPMSEVLLLNADGDFEKVGDFGVDASGPSTVFDPVEDRTLWIGGLPREAFNIVADFHFVALNADFTSEDLRAPFAPLLPKTAPEAIFNPATEQPLFLFGELNAGDTIQPKHDGFILTETGGSVLPEYPVPLFFGERSSLFFDGTTVAFIDAPTASIVTQVGAGWVVTPAPLLPSTAAYAFDHSRDAVISFGGGFTDQTATTLEYRNGVVTELFPTASPPPRTSAIATYDPQRQAVLLYGGFDLEAEFDQQALTDTWMFDGTTWTQIDDDGEIEISPYDLAPPSFFFDENLQRPVIFSGGTFFGLTDAGWSPLPYAMAQERSDAAGVFDPARGQLMMQGGTDQSFRSSSALDVLEHDRSLRPVHIFSVDLRARRAHSESQIESISISARVGGEGYTSLEPSPPTGPDSESVTGGEVLLWQRGWLSLGDNAAGPDATASLTATVDDPSVFPALGNTWLRVGLTSKEGQGLLGPRSESAQVSTDGVEVVVRYRE